MKSTYDQDVVAWAKEQAALLRAGRFDQLDIEHIAEEIEDVGKSEQRELASRMAILLTHLIKWGFQSARRSASWESTINIQRKAIGRRLQKTPSLVPMLTDPDWVQDIWDDARLAASQETGMDVTTFPSGCPWAMEEVFADGFLPEVSSQAGV